MPQGRPKKSTADQPAKNSGAILGFELQLFLAADKLRENLEASDDKQVALDLIFFERISNSFDAKRTTLLADGAAAAEDADEYLAERVLTCPRKPAGRTCTPEATRRLRTTPGAEST